jgi:hypothetical protein
MPKIIACKTCGKDVSSTANTCPSCGQKLKSGLFGKLVKSVVGVFAIFIVLAVFIPAPDDKPAARQLSADQPATQAAAQAAEDVETKPVVDERPTDQIAFLDALNAAREAGRTAENDMQKGAALAKRTAAFCSILTNSKNIEDWHGTIYSIGANSDGKGVVVVTIGQDAWASTWNNAFSDTGTNSLIEPSTQLFTEVSALSSGDKVRFSGELFTNSETCVSMQNMSLSSKINRPEFVFKFSKIEPAQ